MWFTTLKISQMHSPQVPSICDEFLAPLELDPPSSSMLSSIALPSTTGSAIPSLKEFVFAFWGQEEDAQADAAKFLTILQGEKFSSVLDIARFYRAYTAGRSVTKKLYERLTGALCPLEQIKFDDMLIESLKLAPSAPLQLKQAVSSSLPPPSVNAAQLRHPSAVIDRSWFAARLRKWCQQATKRTVAEFVHATFFVDGQLAPQVSIKCTSTHLEVHCAACTSTFNLKVSPSSSTSQFEVDLSSLTRHCEGHLPTPATSSPQESSSASPRSEQKKRKFAQPTLTAVVPSAVVVVPSVVVPPPPPMEIPSSTLVSVSAPAEVMICDL